jgi:hypothetical protein
MSKIHYEELQTMLNNGQSQAECSRHFQVSEAAISKAVKRLKSAEIPASMEKLSTKGRTFVLNLAEGKNATEAALVSYDCKNRDVARTIGCRMAKEPDIELALADLLAQEGLPKRQRIRHLKRLIESNDLSAVSRGLETSFKLDGSFVEKHMVIVEHRDIVADLRAAQQRLIDAGVVIDLETLNPENDSRQDTGEQ